MIISSLRTTAFRNLADSLINTSSKTVFLIGENGQGKTNFIEALYFCVYASSFRRVRDNELARNDVKDFSAEITVINNLYEGNICNKILVKYEKNKKTVIIDGEKIEDRKELLYIIPCIVFCHDDMEFVRGTPEQRRWFFDQVLSIYDPIYLGDLCYYRKAIKMRNIILRENLKQKISSKNKTLLDTLDCQCAFYGVKLMEKREVAARLFSEVFVSLYSEVTGITGITVKYIPSWKINSEKETLEYIFKRRKMDMVAGISMTGPHRDRYSFTIDNKNFINNASTGQQRLLALLLRVAQAQRFSETTGKKPVLLFDDVLLEMDSEKRKRFLSILPEYNQAFFTFLPDEPFNQYQKDKTLIYNVINGQVEYKEGK